MSIYRIYCKEWKNRVGVKKKKCVVILDATECLHALQLPPLLLICAQERRPNWTEACASEKPPVQIKVNICNVREISVITYNSQAARIVFFFRWQVRVIIMTGKIF